MKKVVKYFKKLDIKTLILMNVALIILYQASGQILASIIQGRADMIVTILLGTLMQIMIDGAMLAIVWAVIHYSKKLLHRRGNKDER